MPKGDWLRCGGMRRQWEEVCHGSLKRDTHFLALAADQLQASAGGGGCW